jgi:HJR/Mrr/RecB family endonuclease
MDRSETTVEPIVDKLLLFRLTGQSEITDPVQAQTLLMQARTQEAKAHHDYRAARWPHWRRLIRMLPVVFNVPPLAVGVGAGAVGALFLAVIGIFLLDAGPLSLLVLLVGALLFGAGMVFFQWDEHDETPETRPTLRRQRYYEARVVRHAAAMKLDEARADVARNLRLIDGIQRSRNWDLERLLNVRWERLDGNGFERFLTSVFRHHGYAVELIGKSGDQGVDLILKRDEVRIAVQARCSTGAVGDQAVQQVVAGRMYHRCDLCAVVTNSLFTPSARELSIETACTLIGADQIRSLIRGDIRL